MSETLLTRDLRAIRRVAPPDAPCDATLALVDGVGYLLVDSDDESITNVMSFVGAEHIWAPLDVWRRYDGHDIMMPRVVEPLEIFLERRCDDVLRAGEIVTLSCSVLRGVGELRNHRDGGGSGGRWWTTDAGRPVFALVSGESVAVASARVLSMLAEFAHDRELVKVLDDAARACTAPEEMVLAEIESRLISLAAPQPVELSQLGENRELVREPRAAAALREQRRAAFDHPAQSAPTRRPARFIALILDIATRARAHVARMSLPARRAPVASDNATPRPRNARPTAAADKAAPAPSRKKVWGVAVALAGVIVVGGLLWPSGDSGSSPRASATRAATGEPDQAVNDASPGSETAVPPQPQAVVPTPAVPAQAAPEPAVPEPPAATALVAADGQPELTEVAATLFSGAVVCEAAQSCGAFFADVALVGMIPASGVVELIDDYGGVAVFAVTPPEAKPLTVVIEKRGDNWMIREVYGKTGE